MPVHLVLVTRYRHPAFTAAASSASRRTLPDARADLRSELAEFNGQPEHVHLLVNFPPIVAISRLASSLTGVSSRPLGHQIPGPGPAPLAARRLWSRSYLDGAPISVLRQYIKQQRRPS